MRLCFCLLVIGMSVVTAAIADTIHLKNGTVVEGTIIREIPDVSVAIKTVKGKVFTYNMQDVFEIDRRPSRPVPSVAPFAGDTERPDAQRAVVRGCPRLWTSL